ncbi:Kinesin-related protein 11 [Exophiala dermatitidis]
MSLPVLTRPLADPPTGALPPIPTNKPPRKSLPQTTSRLKAPRASALSPPHPVSSTPDLSLSYAKPSERASGIPSGKTVRKTVSIGSFPQPPNAATRPPTSGSTTSVASSKKRTSDSNGSTSQAPSIKPRKSSKANAAASFRAPQTPSLLNSAGDGMTVSAKAGYRISDAQSSVHSPPQSRSSSANGSYSTNATTIEEGDEDTSRGRTSNVEDSTPGMKQNPKGKETKGNVIVSVRVRPDPGSQTGHQSDDGEWMVDGRRALVAYRGREGGDYHYDNVFTTYDDNAKVYDASAKRLVRRVMEGYHGTVFAYGMTGTGKTFSMQGTMTSPGVIPLAITDIFSYIRETPHREFLLRVSYLEIYNEKIHDLLAVPVGGGVGGSQQEEIKLREDSKRGVYASPLKEEIVQSPTQLLRVIHRGDTARRTGSTQFNARSSRSHAVVQIVVESRERIPGAGAMHENGKRVAMLPGGVRVSTLSLIDLAGSERAADDKERRTEGAHINKSLLTLGTVIARLSGNKDKNGNPTDKDGRHLPYRDSKLTRLLQPALSGNSLVSILCTIQIGAGLTVAGNNNTAETLNTLKFAARAKNNIVSHAKKAAEEVGSGVNSGLLERYRAEIQSLRLQLEGQQKSAAEKEERQIEREAEQRHEEQMLEMQLARTALKERIEHLNRLILCSKSTGVNSGAVSALGMHSRLSGGTEYAGPRSVRSSASQSTLGVSPGLRRYPSGASLGGARSNSGHLSFSAIPDEDEEAGDDYGDGRATLQAQVRALQADLQDKTRYISTLEKRLLQARRSSHSRVSMGFNKNCGDDTEMLKKLEEKDAIISDLQRTVAALRSAVRKRDIAELTPEMSSSEYKQNRAQEGHQSSDSNSSSHTENSSTQQTSGPPRSPLLATSPLALLSPQKAMSKQRKSVDEMSRMLDEMIQDKVESGHLVKGRSPSMRLPARTSSLQRHSRRTSSATGISAPAMGSLVASLRERDSVIESPSPL